MMLQRLRKRLVTCVGSRGWEHGHLPAGVRKRGTRLCHHLCHHGSLCFQRRHQGVLLRHALLKGVCGRHQALCHVLEALPGKESRVVRHAAGGASHFRAKSSDSQATILDHSGNTCSSAGGALTPYSLHAASFVPRSTAALEESAPRVETAPPCPLPNRAAMTRQPPRCLSRKPFRVLGSPLSSMPM